MARELGADERLVAFMQYLRVLVVVLLTPLVAALTGSHTGGAPHQPPFGDLKGWLLTAAAAPAGMLLGRLTRLPAPSLLGPMFVAGAITLAGEAFRVPAALSTVAFATIGLQVGLRFTLETVRQVGRLFVPMLISLLGLLVGCFGLAVLLHLTAPVSLRDAYFATTPGGLYAVLAIALGTATNVTFILATQTFRVLVMVILAPAAVRWVARLGRAPAMETPITPDDPDIPDEPPPSGIRSRRPTISRWACRPTWTPRTRRCPGCPSASRPPPTECVGTTRSRRSSASRPRTGSTAARRSGARDRRARARRRSGTAL